MRSIPYWTGLSTIGASLLCSPAVAVSIPIVNGGFENPALADGTSLVTLGSPWTFNVGSVPIPLTENPAGLGAGVVEGEQRIRLRSGPNGSAVSIQQSLPQVYAVDTVYVFSVTPLDFDGSLVPQFQIRLDGLAATTVQATDLTGALGRETAVSGAILPGSPLLGQNISVSISVFGQGPYYGAVSFDSARLQAVPVPEPSSALLLGMGLSWICTTRARRDTTTECAGRRSIQNASLRSSYRRATGHDRQLQKT